jgi:hypothetical protein
VSAKAGAEQKEENRNRSIGATTFSGCAIWLDRRKRNALNQRWLTEPVE